MAMFLDVVDVLVGQVDAAREASVPIDDHDLSVVTVVHSDVEDWFDLGE